MFVVDFACLTKFEFGLVTRPEAIASKVNIMTSLLMFVKQPPNIGPNVSD